ncbi:MAG: OmpA family protein [Candidatus Delongbacteria bacterium]
MKLKSGTVLLAVLMLLISSYGASLTGHSGMIKLMNPETHGSGYFSLNLSTLMGSGAENGGGLDGYDYNDYFQSTNHLSINVSLGNYVDLGGKASFVYDSAKMNEENYDLKKLNNVEIGIRTSFKREGFFRAGMYLYGHVPVLKKYDDFEEFTGFEPLSDVAFGNTANSVRYYNHRKFSDEFLYNPKSSFGGKLMTSMGNDYFRVLLNGGYLWRTADEKADHEDLNDPADSTTYVEDWKAPTLNILPDVWTLGGGMDIYLGKHARMFLEWDGEILTDKKDTIEKRYVNGSDYDTLEVDVNISGEEFVQRVGGGFKFVGNDNFSATIGSFFALNEHAPKWQVYAGITFSGNMINPDPDSDLDGVCDPWVSEQGQLKRYADVCTGIDKCPNTKPGVPVDEYGCATPDTDNDGVCDPWVEELGLQEDFAKVCTGIDLCPDTPAGAPVDKDGCTEPDTDKDGVCDPWVEELELSDNFSHICKGLDKCPDTPLNVEVDEHGCPDPDSDNDGVCDPWVTENGLSEEYENICSGSDKCPDTPAGVPVDRDGCPNPDRDGDGICDPWVMDMGLSEEYAHICVGSDKCPDEPETVNSFEDDDGCPDAIILKKDETITLDNIYFRLGSADLEPESFQTLNSLRRVFIDNPGIVVRIEGHTDSQGSDAYNLKLSEQRANTVAEYIVNVLGISRDQVSSVGYGEARPVATNKTSAGRAQNRRIEFRVISTR